LPRIAFLAAAGYRCVAFDHRAHGLSAGRCSSFGYYESRDVDAVLDFVAARWPNEFRAALGISMGAAALCFAAERACGFDACVLESLYYDVASAFDNRIGTQFPAWFRRFSRGVIWATERRLGLKLSQVTPADYIANLSSTPVLLVTGTADVHASPEDAERLRRRCTGPRELVEIEGADHTNVCTKNAAAYHKAVLEFLDGASFGVKLSGVQPLANL
jgi:alpha-beta hydrolase superfamily lysophospholipase